jgi:hypothetical protein
MSHNPDMRLLQAIQKLDRERTARVKAEQQARVLKAANDRLRKAVVYWRDHKPDAKPAPG